MSICILLLLYYPPNCSACTTYTESKTLRVSVESPSVCLEMENILVHHFVHPRP